MKLRYRTIKKPPVSGRITLEQAAQAVRAVQEEEALKALKSKLKNRRRGIVAGSNRA
jgi:hypothetical protein